MLIKKHAILQQLVMDTLLAYAPQYRYLWGSTVIFQVGYNAIIVMEHI
ncbi:hypothetical protein [Thalassotalea sp. 1_MG-2023]|nr:hypothetical protein [Thalassotalea sp. 1_MG-2023]